MKVFQSEFVQSYQSYSFGYCNYALKESGDQLSQIYTHGFLPYSGTKGLKDVFYMCRSVRVDLKDWQMNSENRRVYKKFADQLTSKTTAITEFDANEAFMSFCVNYFAERHGATVMPRERIELILAMVTHIREYHLGDKLVGYVFLVSDDAMDHEWQCFYDLTYVQQSLGLWLMADGIQKAQEQGKKHFYLGTAYGDKGLYKTNFDNLEYWTGSEWSGDIARLRDKCRKDSERSVNVRDEWKDMEGHELF